LQSPILVTLIYKYSLIVTAAHIHLMANQICFIFVFYNRYKWKSCWCVIGPHLIKKTFVMVH